MKPTTPITELDRLQADTTAALVEAETVKDQFPNDPINWGDLGCIETAQTRSGKWIVWISEASPDCPNLHQFIQDKLRANWGYVEVLTEW